MLWVLSIAFWFNIIIAMTYLVFLPIESAILFILFYLLLAKLVHSDYLRYKSRTQKKVIIPEVLSPPKYSVSQVRSYGK